MPDLAVVVFVCFSQTDVELYQALLGKEESDEGELFF